MSAQLHLVYATDANYLLPTEVSARSALVKASRPADLVVHILDCGIPDDQWVSFAGRMPQAVRHQIDLSLFQHFRKWHGSLAAYARLCIPELLQNVTWCVYADGDTLFADDPFRLETLYDSGTALFGRADPITVQPAWFKKHGLKFPENRYVCSGFIVMNLDWFRVHHASIRCLSFLREHPDAPFPDQDALNWLCCGYIRLLPQLWGVFSGAAFGVRGEKPGCIHYVGELPCKLPWKWHLGYTDAAALWFVAAKAMLGMSRRDAGGISGLRWYAGRLYNRLIRMAVTVLGILPVMRRRFPNLRTRFAGYAHRGMFKPSFWTDAGLGGARQ